MTLADLPVAAPTPLRGYRFSTAFQPVFSLSHGRLVGHEALLRVRDDDDRPLPPNEVFGALSNLAERADLDVLALRQHLRAYVEAGKHDQPEWLLINLHPASLLQGAGGLQRIESAIRDSGLRPERIVIEVLESPYSEDERFLPALQQLRALGCLIALDDFGAGHSNFERVFDLAPHLVKLDRRVLLRAKAVPRAARILERMVSLLHECGALVLMEGIEMPQGAHIALSSDVDFVQGYLFGRPEPAPLPGDHQSEALEDAWRAFDMGRSRDDDRWRDSMGEHCDRLRLSSLRLAAGAPIAEACADFLAMDQASMCYLLDEHGRQLGQLAFQPGESAQTLASQAQFEPLHNCSNARWSRRQYFRRAVAFPGAVQLTRPYLTLQGGRMCFTASVAFELEGRTVILCGDVVVDPRGDRA